MENLNFYYQIVEKAIAKLGLNPEITRKEKGYWSLTFAGIPVWVYVFFQESEKRAYYLVTSPFMDVPENNTEALAWKLLRTNDELYGISFVERKGKIYLKTLREVEGLDVSEAHAMITRMGYYGSVYRERILGIPQNMAAVGKAKSDHDSPM